MKKNYKKMICLFLGVIILTMAQPVFCSAWGPPKAEDEEKFLEWYEKHKNDQNAVYTLTGDLKLTKGTKEDPIRFDGRGKVRIDCGNHGIIVNSRVIIDNPDLTISGNYMFVLMENSIDSHLILKRGTVLDSKSDHACAVQVIRGTLQTSSYLSVRFTIQMKGKDITGIYHGTDEPLVLRQIDVTAKGTGRVEGVKNNRNQTLSLTDCNIKVSGDQEACGVSNLGRTEVNRCRITASVSDASGTAVSVAGSEISSRDSKIVPEITGMKNTVYSIYVMLTALLLSSAELAQTLNPFCRKMRQCLRGKCRDKREKYYFNACYMGCFRSRYFKRRDYACERETSHKRFVSGIYINSSRNQPW